MSAFHKGWLSRKAIIAWPPERSTATKTSAPRRRRWIISLAALVILRFRNFAGRIQNHSG
jgi:hypothetical protein